MKVVNKYFLINSIDAISFYDSEDCEDVFSDLDVNNESEVKKIIKYRMLINHLIKPETFKEIFKNTLKYYLNKDKVDFEKIYQAGYPSFGLPNEPKFFFIWIWEEFYKGESYILDDLSDYEEYNDHSQLLRIMPYTRNI
ncbi:hypothetical protein [Psychroserpens mesophilus]|uniref:hypothetical protein n=1 Tax=Psychroserpens mesophilus TaxID=325473 RepID=UPI0005902076|nr:hypothetical protein [Psychroserpens mesophilus]